MAERLSPPFEARRPERTRALLFAAFAAVIVLVAAVLTVPAVTTRVVDWALGTVDVAPDTRMTTARVERAGPLAWNLLDWRWTRGDTLLASIDTLRIAGGLGWLWKSGVVDLRMVDARGVVATEAILRLPERPRPADEPFDPADLLRGRFYEGPPLSIAHLRVERARFLRDGDAGARLVVRALEARDVVLGPRFAFALDSLAAVGWPRGEADSVVVAARGALSEGRLDLTRLALDGVAGTLDLRGHAAVDGDDTLSAVALAGRAIAIDLEALSAIFPALDAAGRLEGDVDLRGPSPARWSGHASFRGRDLYVAGAAMGESRLDATFVNGRGEGTFATVLEGAPVAGSGSVRLGVRPAAYEVRAVASRLPERLPGMAWWDAFARRSPARVEIEVSSAPGGSRFTMQADGPAGSFLGRGVADFDSSRTWSLERLDFERLDLARLTGSGRSTSLRGTVSGRGGFVSGESSHADLTIAIAPSRVADWEIRDAHAEARIRGRELNASLDLSSDAGSLVARRIEARIDGDGPVRFDGVVFRDVDLARLLDRPDLASRLDGTIDGTASGLREGPTAARAEVRLSASRFRQIEIQDASFGLALDGKVVRVDGTAHTSGGHVELVADARPFDAAPTVGVERARFERFDLGVWTGQPRLATDLTGTLEGDGRIALGSGALASTWRGHLRLGPSTLARTRFAGGDADVSWSADSVLWNAQLFAVRDSDAVKSEGTLVTREGALAGGARLSVPLALVVHAAGHDTLPARGRIDADVRFAGRSLETLDGQAVVTGRGAIGEATLDTLAALIALRTGTVWVDTLFARSNAGAATATGAVALFDTTARPPALRVDVALSDASRLRPLFAMDSLFVGSGTLALTLEGPAYARALDATGELRAVAWNGGSVFGAQLGAHGLLGRDFRPSDLRWDAAFRRLHAFGMSVQNGTVRLDQRGDSVLFDLEAGPDTVHRAHVAGVFANAGTVRRILLTAYDARSDSTSWSLARPANIDLEHDRIVVRDFDLRSDGGDIVAEGDVDRSGDSNFRLFATNVDLAGIFAWFGRDEAAGTMDGAIELLGPATAPRGAATFTFGLVDRGQPRGTVRSFVRWNGSRAQVDGSFTTPVGDSLVWEGSLPLAFSLARTAVDTTIAAARPRLFDGDVDLRVFGQRFPLASIASFLGPIEEIELAGMLDVDVRVRGPSHALAGSGRLDVTGGALRLPESGVDYRQMELRSQFEGDRWRIEQASAASGSGRLDANGDIVLASVTHIVPELTVRADDFELVEDDRMHAVASGEVAISGTLARPEATGRITFENSSYEFVQSDLQGGDQGPEIRLTAADVRQMQEVFGFAREPRRNALLDLYDASKLDLETTLGGSVWLRQRVQPTLALPLQGEFRLTKLPQEQPRAVGEVRVVERRGSIEQFGRRFTITSGSASLHGMPEDHRFTVQAEFAPPSRQGDPESGAVVRLEVAGRLEAMTLTLSSEPAMSQTEIVAFLATGQSRTLRRSGQSPDPGGLAADIGLSQVTGFAQSAAQEAVGLDVLQVRFDPIEGATLVAGNYVTSRLYVGFVQPFQFSDDSSEYGVISRTSIELEQALRRWLVLNLRGETSQLRSFIRVRHAY